MGDLGWGWVDLYSHHLILSLFVFGYSWWVPGRGWLICAKRDMKLGRRKVTRRYVVGGFVLWAFYFTFCDLDLNFYIACVFACIYTTRLIYFLFFWMQRPRGLKAMGSMESDSEWMIWWKERKKNQLSGSTRRGKKEALLRSMKKKCFGDGDDDDDVVWIDEWWR